MTRIAVLQPLSAPVTQDVPAAWIWKTAGKIIGGYVEVAYLTEPAHDTEKYAIGWHLAAYVNEDGIALGQPLNRMIGEYVLYGPVVIVRERIDGDGDTHYADLTDADLELIRAADNILIPGATRASKGSSG